MAQIGQPSKSDGLTYRQRYYQSNKRRVKAQNKAWRQANADKFRKYQTDWQRNHAAVRRAEIRRILEEAKSKPCADCGNEYPRYVMDFDHCRGKKKFTIGIIQSRVHLLPHLLAEIAKCDVVCSNCHRIRTFTRKGLIKRKRR